MKRLLIFILLSAASILPAWNDIDLKGICSFVYQLQDLDLDAMGVTSFGLVIMDYSAEGDGETAYSDEKIEVFKLSSGD
jgi:endo-alpha-1,4-polygalactosaminidase (GH114 family)